MQVIPLYLMYLSVGSALIPLVLLFFNAKPRSKAVQLLLVLAGIGFSLDIISLWLIASAVNTYPLGNSFLIVQFVLLGLIYYYELKASRTLLLIIVFGTVVFLVDNQFISGWTVLNKYANTITGLILIFLAIYYLYNLVFFAKEGPIYKFPMLWVSFAVLVYYGGNLFIFLTNNYFLINNYTDSHKFIWTVHNILNIIKNGLFAIAIWQNLRNKSFSLL